MTSLRPTRKPVFLWQAGLILLPVLIIAAVALTSIIQNRTEVEREARRRAEELARQYGKELASQLGAFLLQHDFNSACWSDYLVEVTGGWPGSQRRAQVEAECHLPPDPPYPGWRTEQVYPDRFGLTANGRFAEGLEFNPAPQPPAWFTALSTEQRAAWEALKSAAASGAGLEDIERHIVRFEETGPELAARLNAAFIGLRARLATLPPALAVPEALWVARGGPMLVTMPVSTHGAVRSEAHQLPSPLARWETLSEAGVPLVNLAFEEALRYARVTGPSEELWWAMHDQVLRAPSPLTPVMLDQLQTLAATNTALQAGVEAWRTLWNARLKLYDIADAVRQAGKLRGVTTTNFWIEHDQTRWLCILNPEPASMLRTVNGVTLQPTNGLGTEAGVPYVSRMWDSVIVQPTNEVWTEVRFLPKAVVEHALARALENCEVKLPGYLGIYAWLEGERLPLPKRWSPPPDTNSAPPFLAEASGTLSTLGKLRTPGGSEIEREGLPSRPRFNLQLYVADPALLLASYRRQALLLAALVAASAFGALIGVFATWRAFQRQLRLNELKSNFVSSVSHELRAPIASVRLMAESLERGKISEAPKQHEYFRFIVQECRRLSSLIENVLDFSRIEQGRKQYDLEPTDLVALTQQTVKLMETYAAERGVNLQFQLPDTINHQLPDYRLPAEQLPDYQLPADGKALQQALVNLIDNALKHSPKGDTVRVGLEMQNGECRMQNAEPRSTPHPARSTPHVSRFTFHLWVEDHGEGIPPSEHQKIFERFYRRGSELRRQTQGVGIGLSIVKHIVEAHGGRVMVRSAVGQGSRFTIELPVSSTTTKPEARNPKPE